MPLEFTPEILQEKRRGFLISPEMLREREDITEEPFAKAAYKSFQMGLSQFWASVARLPAVTYNLAALPQNLLMKAIGKADRQVRAPNWLLNNPVAKFYDKQAVAWQPKELQKDPFDYLRKGDYRGAIRNLTMQVVANAPNQIAIITGVLAGYGTPVLIGMGGLQAAQVMKTGEEKKLDPVQITTNAALQGTIEGCFETIGTAGILKTWAGALAKSFGAGSAKQIVKDVGKTLAYSFFGEGNEEFWTSLGQDFSDVVTGTNPDAMKGSIQRALNAFAVGALSGAGMTSPSAITTGIISAEIAKASEATAKEMREVVQADKFEEKLKKIEKKRKAPSEVSMKELLERPISEMTTEEMGKTLDALSAMHFLEDHMEKKRLARVGELEKVLRKEPLIKLTKEELEEIDSGIEYLKEEAEVEIAAKDPETVKRMGEIEAFRKRIAKGWVTIKDRDILEEILDIEEDQVRFMLGEGETDQPEVFERKLKVVDDMNYKIRKKWEGEPRPSEGEIGALLRKKVGELMGPEYKEAQLKRIREMLIESRVAVMEEIDPGLPRSLEEQALLDTRIINRVYHEIIGETEYGTEEANNLYRAITAEYGKMIEKERPQKVLRKEPSVPLVPPKKEVAKISEIDLEAQARKEIQKVREVLGPRVGKEIIMQTAFGRLLERMKPELAQDILKLADKIEKEYQKGEAKKPSPLKTIAEEKADKGFLEVPRPLERRDFMLLSLSQLEEAANRLREELEALQMRKRFNLITTEESSIEHAHIQDKLKGIERVYEYKMNLPKLVQHEFALMGNRMLARQDLDPKDVSEYIIHRNIMMRERELRRGMVDNDIYSFVPALEAKLKWMGEQDLSKGIPTPYKSAADFYTAQENIKKSLERILHPDNVLILEPRYVSRKEMMEIAKKDHAPVAGFIADTGEILVREDFRKDAIKSPSHKFDYDMTIFHEKIHGAVESTFTDGELDSLREKFTKAQLVRIDQTLFEYGVKPGDEFYELSVIWVMYKLNPEATRKHYQLSYSPELELAIKEYGLRIPQKMKSRMNAVIEGIRTRAAFPHGPLKPFILTAMRAHKKGRLGIKASESVDWNKGALEVSIKKYGLTQVYRWMKGMKNIWKDASRTKAEELIAWLEENPELEISPKEVEEMGGPEKRDTWFYDWFQSPRWAIREAYDIIKPAYQAYRDRLDSSFEILNKTKYLAKMERWSEDTEMVGRALLGEKVSLTPIQAEAFEEARSYIRSWAPVLVEQGLLPSEYVGDKELIAALDERVKELYSEQFSITDYIGGEIPIPRKMRKRMMKEGKIPCVFSMLERYTYAMSKYVHMLPAIQQARALRKGYTPTRQKMLDVYIRWMQGRPTGVDVMLRDNLVKVENLFRKLFRKEEIVKEERVPFLSTQISGGLARWYYWRYIGFALDTALMNSIQWTQAIAATSYPAVSWAWYARYTKEGRALCEKAGIQKEGLLRGKHFIGEYAFEAISGFERASYWLFEMFDKNNRTISFLAGYKWGLNHGMSTEEAMKHGWKVSHETQYGYTKADSLLVDMSDAGAFSRLILFKKWPLMQIEMIRDWVNDGRWFAVFHLALLDYVIYRVFKKLGIDLGRYFDAIYKLATRQHPTIPLAQEIKTIIDAFKPGYEADWAKERLWTVLRGATNRTFGKLANILIAWQRNWEIWDAQGNLRYKTTLGEELMGLFVQPLSRTQRRKMMQKAREDREYINDTREAIRALVANKKISQAVKLEMKLMRKYGVGYTMQYGKIIEPTIPSAIMEDLLEEQELDEYQRYIRTMPGERIIRPEELRPEMLRERKK